MSEFPFPTESFTGDETRNYDGLTIIQTADLKALYIAKQKYEDFYNTHAPSGTRTPVAPKTQQGDPVNPTHYKEHPSKVECITITEHMNFCLGNAMKHIWRADMKNDIEDLKKAHWYLEREIRRREKTP